MLTDEQAAAASELIWRHWRKGRRMPSLPAPLRPATRAEGYAIQAWIERRSARPLFGWKIAATSEAGQRHIGVDGLFAGRLLAEQVFAAGAPLLIADNACAHQLVLGPAVTADWRALDLAAHRVRGTVAGRIEREGIGANVLGDPRLALTWLANELSRHGVALGAGQVVTTGTCLVPMEVDPGDAVSADYGALGSIAFRFVG
jgi:2-keto-4-pentenoate hydratase